MKLHRSPVHDSSHAETTAAAPGRRTRSESLPSSGHVDPVQLSHGTTPYLKHEDPFAMHLIGSPVQLRGDEPSGTDVHTAAAHGVSGSGGSLPFLDEIQTSFGAAHDVSRVDAHIGGTAADASAAMGARAYATGNHVAFAAPPDLHTAAHEAAHVVQQRSGVQVVGGVGVDGDRYERHADEVADAVVRGDSAASLLDASTAPSSGHVVQRKAAGRDDLASTAKTMASEGDDVRELLDAVSTLWTAKQMAENILRQFRSGLSQLDAASLLARTIDEEAAPATTKIARVHADGTDRGRRTGSFNLWTRTAALNEQDEQGELASTLQLQMPKIVDALNNIVRCALEVASGAPDASQDVSLASSMLALGVAAKPLGWTPPASPDEAQARRLSFEPCPEGARDELPETCDLSDAARAGLRAELGFLVERAADEFYVVADGFSDTLEKAIESDAAAADALNGVLADAMQTLAMAIGPQGPLAGTVASYAWGLHKSVVDATAAAARAGDPRNDTVSTLAVLRDAVGARLSQTRESARALNDKALRRLVLSFEGANREFFRPRVESFVARYRAQIEPIGHRMPGHFIPEFDHSHLVQKPVWIERGRGSKRLALVGHQRRDPRSALAARDEYRFVQWIDADLAALADAESAPSVPAHQVTGYPLVQMDDRDE